jgi:hypothetical protein
MFSDLFCLRVAIRGPGKNVPEKSCVRNRSAAMRPEIRTTGWVWGPYLPVERGVRRDRLEGPRAAPWPAGPPARFGLRPCALFLGTGLRAVGTVPGSWLRQLVDTWTCWMPSAYTWCPRESDACHNCSIGKAATADRPNSLHNPRNASGVIQSRNWHDAPSMSQALHPLMCRSSSIPAPSWSSSILVSDRICTIS